MNKIKGKFIIDIVPLTRIPLIRNQSFSYLSDEKLSSGTLVSIPLFRRKVEGIVLGSKDDFERIGGIKLKKIEKVLEKKFLTENQIKLARFMSDYYISSLGIAMKVFVPKRTKSRKYNVSSIKHEKKEIILTPKQKEAVDVISGKHTSYKIPDTRYLLFGPSGSGKTEVYIHSILKLRENNKNLQFLILVPEQTLTPQALERYGAYFKPEEIVVLSSNITRGQFFKNWLRVKSGEAKIVIATRKGAFSPFVNLGLIVVDEEQDMSYKQWDMNPRYDARKVAEKIAELHKCPIVFGSATPRLESYYKAKNGEYILLNLPHLQIPDTKYQIQDTILVDMKKERWNNLPHRQTGNHSCISKKLKGEIDYVLRNKLQAVLFINRQGMSNFSVCASCKTVLKCPKCERALILTNEGIYRCIHCSYKSSVVPKCEKCHGMEFTNIGLGTQKVEREIANFFPGARIARLDSQSIKAANFQEKVYKDMSQGKIDILIGTQMISKGWDLPRVALAGIIDADNMLSIPDFNSSELAFERIYQVAGRTGRPGSKFPGKVIIQTYNPQNRILKLAAERDYKSFFNQEIEEKKALKLPPFGKIIKLVFQDYSHKKTETAAEEIFEMMKKTGVSQISEPQDCYVPKIRGRFRKQIIIKLKNTKEIPQEIRKILKALPSGWIVDVDPISII